MRPRLTVERLDPRLVPTVFVNFDYTYDTAGFFADPVRRQALERVAASVTSRLTDTLSAITPGGGNTWTAGFFNPFTNQTVQLTNPSIAADEIRVYVGGGTLQSTELGLTSGGSYSGSGSQAWLNLLRGRGEPGALTNPPTDEAPWGGFIGFDARVNWNFTTDAPTANQYDFEAVAAHEMLHIFGFGLGGAAFTRNILNSQFVGPAVLTVNGGPAAVSAGEDPDHWAAGTTFGGQSAIMVPSIPEGVKRPITELDYAAIDDIGWELVPAGTVPPVVPPAVPPPPTSPPPGEGTPVRFVVAADGVSVPSAAGVNGSGEFVFTTQPFDAAVTGGVRVASGDFNADGVRDIVVGTGPGGASDVRILNGRTQAELFRIAPFEPAFLGGVYVAAGDLTGDGRPELIVTPDEGGGPRVRVFNGRTFDVLADFFGIDDPDFRGGARAAVGDITGDGTGDLIVAAGFGGGPRVAGYTGQSVRTGRTPVKAFADFFAFEQTLRNGVYVAAGDLDADGRADLIAGGGPGGGPRVTALSGRSLVSNTYVPLANFFAGDESGRGGVRVAVANLDGDGRADLVTGAGAGAGSRLSGYAGSGLTANGVPTAAFDFDFYPGFAGGLFVG